MAIITKAGIEHRINRHRNGSAGIIFILEIGEGGPAETIIVVSALAGLI